MAGAHAVQAALNGANISAAQALSVAPGPAQLNRCVVIVEPVSETSSGAASLAAAEPASVALNASDRYGNVFSLVDALQARSHVKPPAQLSCGCAAPVRACSQLVWAQPSLIRRVQGAALQHAPC